MLYVISYDIEDDRVRNRVSDVLQGYGIRVQKSVFECDLSSAQYKALTQTLAKILEKGNIRIYQICATCRAKAVGIGDVRLAAPLPDFWVG